MQQAEEDMEEEEVEGIDSRVKKIDPLAEFNIDSGKTLDFESWNTKKDKIFAFFKQLNDGNDIIIDERRDRDLDRPIRLGKGKSRMDQLAPKSGKSSSSTGQTISAQEFTEQLEKLNKELKKFWDKEDKVACIRIAIQCAKLLNDVATPTFYP
mmetsp:Transcript_86810/g.119530  ORF Transcript_86810/g.119530 Transcript_86810/m.119530 type:complete len:153 (-) Transcript_86810:433-891(-)